MTLRKQTFRSRDQGRPQEPILNHLKTEFAGEPYSDKFLNKAISEGWSISETSLRYKLFGENYIEGHGKQLDTGDFVNLKGFLEENLDRELFNNLPQDAVASIAIDQILSRLKNWYNECSFRKGYANLFLKPQLFLEERTFWYFLEHLRLKKVLLSITNTPPIQQPFEKDPAISVDTQADTQMDMPPDLSEQEQRQWNQERKRKLIEAKLNKPPVLVSELDSIQALHGEYLVRYNQTLEEADYHRQLIAFCYAENSPWVPLRITYERLQQKCWLTTYQQYYADNNKIPHDNQTVYELMKQNIAATSKLVEPILSVDNLTQRIVTISEIKDISEKFEQEKLWISHFEHALTEEFERRKLQLDPNTQTS